MTRSKLAIRVAVALGLVMIVGLAAACSSDDGSTTTATTTATAAASAAPTGTETDGAIEVVLTDFAVRPSADSAPHGSVTFAARNGGEVAHELVVIRSDAEPGALPQAEGKVDEAQVDVVGEIPEMKPGTGDSEAFELEAGRYLLICNVVGHYAAGMVATFTVE
jgi:uncharacterized cupredoxin-like copper-binding protein